MKLYRFSKLRPVTKTGEFATFESRLTRGRVDWKSGPKRAESL